MTEFGMRKISLNGSSWRLKTGTGRESFPASVPGCVHTDLLAAGRIPDPWWRDNETRIQWVWLEDWIYSREFNLSADDIAQPILLLQCDGLDTLASVRVNGVAVLSANNMFRRWEADIRGAARAGRNEIEVCFASPRQTMLSGNAARCLPGWNLFHEDFEGKSYVRKMGCAFGWDWGLMVPTAGIWRGIRILAGRARFTDVRVDQVHREDGLVQIKVSGSASGAARRGRLTLSRAGGTALERRFEIANGTFVAALLIEDPELWWPNGMGEQPLYDVRVEALDEDGACLDMHVCRIGLRTLDLVREPDAHGTSFVFRVNGRRIFAKGANWIPCDVFPSRIAPATYERLLRDAAASHFNMIRVWGGGIYEDPHFYDLCDAFGLLVWQDFMFACSTYPTFDQAFMENVRAEAVEAVRSLRHRACLALWCGNNEIEQGFVDWEGGPWSARQMPAADYGRLFDEVLPGIVAGEDGCTPYWPCSPHTPGSNRAQFNDPAAGDAHAWSVWFGGEPFEAQRKWTFRFMSEFGFQSFPEPRTVESFTLPEDRALNSWIMDFHQRSGPGNGTIFRYLLEWFAPPRSFEDTLWMTQLTQALCIQYAAEHARRIQSRMDGLLYWQLNDLWPGATWSSIDVFGRWKALQYFAKRFFAPVHLSIVESLAHSTMELHVSNHRAEAPAVRVHWAVTDGAGTVLRDGVEDSEIASQSNCRVATLEVSDLRADSPKLPLEIKFCPHPPRASDRDLVLWAWVETDGREVSRNMAFFAKPKHLALRRPNFGLSVEAEEPGCFHLRIETDVPSPWTQLEWGNGEARFSDNFLHLHPLRAAEIVLWTDAGFTAADIERDLRLIPLCDRSKLRVGDEGLAGL